MNKQSPEVEETGHIIFAPDTNLKQRIMAPGSSRDSFKQAMTAANQALTDLSAEFENWIKDEVKNLENLTRQLKQIGWQEELADKIYTQAHDFKGQATTLGYPVISEISDSLCHLLEKAPDKSNIDCKVIELFTSSISTIVKEQKKDQESPKANAIALALRQLTIKTISQQNSPPASSRN